MMSLFCSSSQAHPPTPLTPPPVPSPHSPHPTPPPPPQFFGEGSARHWLAECTAQLDHGHRSGLQPAEPADAVGGLRLLLHQPPGLQQGPRSACSSGGRKSRGESLQRERERERARETKSTCLMPTTVLRSFGAVNP